MKTLKLTLSKAPFEVMVTGEKKEEFREGGSWIRSRLFNKDDTEREYDLIEFTNGYGAHRPSFTCKFDGFVECYMNVATREYSNGLKVEGIGKGDFVILCGEVTEIRNYN